jgi:CDP-glucose 4,6-dehydratase
MDRVTALWGEGLRWERDAGSHPQEAEVLRLDSGKARRELDWRPRLRLDEALEWTVRWYKDCLRGGDARDLSLRQIERYQALAAA